MENIKFSFGNINVRSCDRFISSSKNVLSMVLQNPTSYSIYSTIQILTSTSVTCSGAEKIVLESVSASVEDAIQSIEDEKSHIQSTIIGEISGNDNNM